MRFIFFIFISVVFITPALSQESDNTFGNKVIDSLYKEDQFYIGVTYNLLGQKPEGLSQNGFSSGFHFGFTKDMPINKRRNIAIGLGVGLSLNSFNQNLQIAKTDGNNLEFSIIDDTDYSKNKFSTYMLEVPLEFRWRTSTAVDYKFWRIYTGFKFGYLFANNTKFEGQPENMKLSNLDIFNKFQYGLSLSAGYNTWNFYFYYSLNPIFKNEAQINGQIIDANALKVGLIFFIL
ncbi:porin family protein [Lacinutrix sp. 5H-3-7-4]|uniref:porin family protein n=1 Tax=Lacinutrix sp. (strain 5H-3-7-4) TaxID=983544 RepID=UPI00059C0E46|nr:porin family protein [Lacinutrix sp. 5H-3-7-4]